MSLCPFPTTITITPRAPPTLLMYYEGTKIVEKFKLHRLSFSIFIKKERNYELNVNNVQNSHFDFHSAPFTNISNKARTQQQTVKRKSCILTVLPLR